MYKLSAIHATFKDPVLHNNSFYLAGSLPIANTENFKHGLHSFTEGEGVFITRPCGYSKIESNFPSRKRVDYNPLNRKDYLLHVL